MSPSSRPLLAGAILQLASGSLSCAAAAEAWAAALATSDYVHRGLSQSDAQPAVQAGAGYSFAAGVYASVWGSTVSNARTTLPDVAGQYEVSVMAGYERALGNVWEVDLAVLRYRYPDSDAGVNYGYREYALSLRYDGWLQLGVATSPDTTIYTRRGLDRRITTYAWEIAAQRPLGMWLSGLAGIGYLDLSDGNHSGYGYFNLGLAARRAPLELEVQYIDTNGGTAVFGSRLAGPRIVATLLVSFR